MPRKKVGKPEMILEKQCKVCKLAQSKIDVYTITHTLRFQDKYTLRRLADYLKELLEKEGYTPRQIPNASNLSLHFRKHIDAKALSQYKMQNTTKETRKKTKKDLVPDEVKQEVVEIVDEEVSAYFRMEKLYKLISDQVDGLVMPSADEDYLNKGYYKSFTSLVKELRMTLTDIEDMKNKRTLMTVVIGTVLQCFTEGVLQRLFGETEEFKKTLAYYIKDKMIINSVCSPLEQSIGRHVMECSNIALDRVVKEYKIK